MANSLTSLTDNFVEGLHNGKCKDCKSSLEYMTAKDDLLTFKCMYCKKTYEKTFNENLSKDFKKHISNVMETLLVSASCGGMVFIHVST